MARVQRVPVVGSEPVKQRETRVQFQNALPEVLNAVPGAIGHRHVHIAVCVYDGPLAGHPDTSLRPGGRSAENAGGLQRGGVERHQPTLIWHDVLPRVPRGVDTPICQSQGRALIVLRGAEGPARTIWPRYRRTYYSGASRFLLTGGDIQGMEALVVDSTVFGACNHIQRPAGLIITGVPVIPIGPE